MTALLAALDTLIAEGQGLAWGGFAVFVRVGATMALLPAFGESAVPVRVRLALTVAFTAAVAPAVALPPLPAGLAAAGAILSEAAAGLVLGIGFRLLVLALQTAGAMAAQATSLSQAFGAAGADPQPAIGHVLTVGGLALAVSLGLHVRVVEALVLSYEVMPAGKSPMATDVAQWGLAQISRAFSLAFSLAAPFVIGSLIYNAALGAINRAMPQLMVAFVGAPALTAGGLILLAVLAPVMLAIWLTVLSAFLADPFAMPP